MSSSVPLPRRDADVIQPALAGELLDDKPQRLLPQTSPFLGTAWWPIARRSDLIEYVGQLDDLRGRLEDRLTHLFPLAPVAESS